MVPALAVLQHGVSAGPLAALVAADGFLHGGGSPEDLVTALQWVRYHPRTSALRRMLDLADGRHESPGETVLGHLLRAMDLPVRPQFEVTATAFRAVVDFLVEGEGVVIEFDGKVKYMRSANEPDPFGNRSSASEVVWAEKRREDRIRDLDLEIVRVVWSDLDDPRELERRIRSAIARARRRRSPRSA